MSTKSRFGRLKRSRGQGMTEYIIVVALVGIAAIGVTSVFGQDVRALFGAVTQAMTGSTNVTNHAMSDNVATPTGYGPKNLGNAYTNQ